MFADIILRSNTDLRFRHTVKACNIEVGVEYRIDPAQLETGTRREFEQAQQVWRHSDGHAHTERRSVRRQLKCIGDGGGGKVVFRARIKSPLSYAYRSSFGSSDAV